MFADALIFGGATLVGLFTCIALRNLRAAKDNRSEYSKYIERVRLLHRTGSMYGRVISQIGKFIGIKSQVSTLEESTLGIGDRVYLYGGAHGRGYKTVAVVSRIEGQELEVTMFDRWRAHERRHCDRVATDMAIMCDDYPMNLVDVSNEGCRASSSYFLKPGEECRLAIGTETVPAVVLSSSPVGDRHEIRFLFVTPITVKPT